jgi:hypothetical protein
VSSLPLETINNLNFFKIVCAGFADEIEVIDHKELYDLKVFLSSQFPSLSHGATLQRPSLRGVISTGISMRIGRIFYRKDGVLTIHCLCFPSLLC